MHRPSLKMQWASALRPEVYNMGQKYCVGVAVRQPINQAWPFSFGTICPWWESPRFPFLFCWMSIAPTAQICANCRWCLLPRRRGMLAPSRPLPDLVSLQSSSQVHQEEGGEKGTFNSWDVQLREENECGFTMQGQTTCLVGWVWWWWLVG